MHFKRSVNRVAHTVCKGNTQAYNAFKSIGYHTLNATSVDDIKLLFGVLCGDLPIQQAVKLMPTSLALRTYASSHNQSSWRASASWCEWWTRSRHRRQDSHARVGHDATALNVALAKLQDMLASVSATLVIHVRMMVQSTCAEDLIDLTLIEDGKNESDNQCWRKCGDIRLSMHHQKIISSGAWLDDLIICAAQTLLQHQHPCTR